MSIKSFKEFLLESINVTITESGNAIENSRPIKQYEIPDTLKDIEKNLLTKLLQLEKHEFALLGSAGKKINPNDVSGDIDMGISVHKVAGVLQCDFTEVMKELTDFLLNKGYEVTPLHGASIVSVGYPIQSKEGGFVQLDLMLSEDIEWTKFAWHSTDFRVTKSKYKGAYRNILLRAIAASYVFEETKAEEDVGKIKKGDVLLVDRFSLDLRKGLNKVVNSYEGKKPGTIVKNATTLSKDTITNNPEKLVKILLGDDFTIEDADRFETLLNCINNPKFKNYNKRDVIIETFKKDLIKQKMAIPSEIE